MGRVLSVNCDQKTSDLSMYQIYASDIGTIPSLNTTKNRALLLEINFIISRLSNLFLEIGFDDKMFLKCRAFWLAEKIEFCLNNCKNKELLRKVEEEYGKYLLLSSEMIEGNLRLVIEIAGEYNESSLFSFEDIIQYGNIGLMRAIEKYNTEYDTAFSTYASLWIRQSITRNINGIKSAYRIPSNVVYEGYELIKKKDELDLLKGKNTDIKELSDYFGLSISKIEELKITFYDSVSLDEELGTSYSDVDMTRGDMIADLDVDVYEEGTRYIRMQELENDLMKYLTPRQFSVISKYIGLDGINHSIEEIAELLNISPQRVGQLKREAVKKLSLIPSFIKKILY